MSNPKQEYSADELCPKCGVVLPCQAHQIPHPRAASGALPSARPELQDAAVKAALQRAKGAITTPADDALIDAVEALASALASSRGPTPDPPYLCPLCFGRGHVPSGFYTSTVGVPWATSTTAPDMCRMCEGKGYLSASRGSVTRPPQDVVGWTEPIPSMPIVKAKPRSVRLDDDDAGVTRPPEPQGWQPIETAPKDRTEILVWDEEDKTCYTAFWNPTADAYCIANGEKAVATYWMPLPAPPSSGAAKKEK